MSEFCQYHQSSPDHLLPSKNSFSAITYLIYRRALIERTTQVGHFGDWPGSCSALQRLCMSSTLTVQGRSPGRAFVPGVWWSEDGSSPSGALYIDDLPQLTSYRETSRTPFAGRHRTFVPAAHLATFVLGFRLTIIVEELHPSGSLCPTPVHRRDRRAR